MLPERYPTKGLLILRDSESGEPEATLLPQACHCKHRAEIEAVVQIDARDVTLEPPTASVGVAVSTYRTLGGPCNWVEAEAPRLADLPIKGGASPKAAIIHTVLPCSVAGSFA